MSNRNKALLCTFASAALVAVVFSSLSYAVTPDRIAGAIDAGKTIPLPKSLHSKAQAQYDRGPVDPSFKLSSMTLMIAPSAAQQKALKKLLAEQQDRTSPNYHKWLTPSQYADRFGLSQNDMLRITTWLESQGFVIESVGGGRNMIRFSGSAAQVHNAFKAEIHRYNIDGEEHFANATPLMLPAALRGVVSGILGVNNFRMQPANRSQTNSGPTVRPDYYDGTFSVFKNFLAPADIATIYDIPVSTLDGTGQKIAVVGRTDIFLADLNDFRSAFGLTQIVPGNCTLNGIGIITACNDPHFKYVLFLPSGGTDPGVPDSNGQGDVLEADIDVEWSGAVAPNAQIIYVNSPDPAGNGVQDSLLTAINPPTGPPLAPVISMSYGICEINAVDLETQLMQAAAMGVTVVNSSGDSGAAACDNSPSSGVPYSGAVGGLAVNYPASSQYVVAVGASAISLADDSYPNPATTYWATSNGTNGGSALTYIPETAWNDDVEWAAYCAFGTAPTFCNQGGPPAVTITSAQTAQEDFWIKSGGGGASNCFTETAGACTGGFAQPSWQVPLAGKVPNAPAGVRWLPDVSFLASPNFPGYILCTPQAPDATPTPTYTSTCVNGISGSTGALEAYNSVAGGTSVSAPVFAGMVALLNQYLSSTQGDIHPLLYQLAATPSNKVFHPITSGDNMVYCQPGQPATQPPTIQCPAGGVFGFNASDADPTTGYNLVTGLGSVDMGKLAAASSSFTLTASALTPASVLQGSSATSTVTLTVQNTFTGTVTFSCSNLPAGTTCNFSPATLTGNGTTTLTIATQLSAAPGTYTVTVSGTSGLQTNSTTVSLVITSSAQSFTLSASPLNPASVNAGLTTTSTVTVTPGGAFGGAVTLSCSAGLPTGASCTFSPATATSSSYTSTLTISTVPTMKPPNGPATITITGTSGSLSSTTTVSLTVETFALAPAAGTYTVTQGSSVTATINLTPTNGFNTALTYTCSIPTTATGANCTGPSGASTQTSLGFQISTVPPSFALRQPLDRGSRILYAVLLPGLLGVMFTVGSRKRPLRGMRMLGLIMVLGVSTIWLASCGSSKLISSKTGGTPKGTYTVTINATTGGAVPITGQTTFQLVVQ